jgi:hypothetical protein
LTVHFVFRLPAFKKLSQKIQDVPEFGAWLQQGTPEQCVPQLWEEEKQLSPIGSAMYQLLVIQVHSSFKYSALLPVQNVMLYRVLKGVGYHEDAGIG